MSQSTFQSHLTVLEKSFSLFRSSPALRIPQIGQRTGKVENWRVITYQDFYNDIQRVAKHWIKTLEIIKISKGSVIALWLSGWSYSDVVHIYGVSRAGYIPQLFSLKLPNPDVVFELLKKADARALIYDPAFEENIRHSPVPFYQPADLNELLDMDDHPLPKLPGAVNENDIMLIFHTSGSTSGSPKLVPCSAKWLDSIVSKAKQVGKPIGPTNRRDVCTWMGSVCHIAQTFMFIAFFQHGACTVQPTQVAFSPQELEDMINRCGLNRLNQFASFLGAHIQNSQNNPRLLGLLKSLDELLYSGLALGKLEESWACRNGVSLKNIFGSTECGAMMSSAGGPGSNPSVLHLLEGVSYKFIPLTPTTSQPENENEASTKLLEMVILSSSRDCPHPSLRSPASGHFYTGDLFEEVTPGAYEFRGRNDDWIKSQTGLRCDTKSIEDNVRSTCYDIVVECVVVGNGRPSPALFIEPVKSDVDSTELKEAILQRIKDFHSRRYLHERISSTRKIIIVEHGTLPRTSTKGNIRRKAVEENFQELLDEVYSAD